MLNRGVSVSQGLDRRSGERGCSGGQKGCFQNRVYQAGLGLATSYFPSRLDRLLGLELRVFRTSVYFTPCALAWTRRRSKFLSFVSFVCVHLNNRPFLMGRAGNLRRIRNMHDGRSLKGLTLRLILHSRGRVCIAPLTFRQGAGRLL